MKVLFRFSDQCYNILMECEKMGWNIINNCFPINFSYIDLDGNVVSDTTIPAANCFQLDLDTKTIILWAKGDEAAIAEGFQYYDVGTINNLIRYEV